MDYFAIYADFLKNSLAPRRPLRIVFDCSNGTTGLVLEKLFRDPSLRSGQPSVFLVNEKPDGRFPAHGPNPLAAGAFNQLSAEVISKKADLGAIFDADGDRVFFVDNLGRPIEPAGAILLLSDRFGVSIALPVNVGPFVREQLSSRGRQVLDSRVGHYFLKKIMREKDLDFCAEQSGHYYFKKFFGLDSGIFAAIEFINAASALSGPLSDWIATLPPHWISEEINFEVADKEAALKKLKKLYERSAQKTSDLDGLSFEFADWWFNVRPSNTEDLLRLNLEAKSKKIFDEKMAEISSSLK